MGSNWNLANGMAIESETTNPAKEAKSYLGTHRLWHAAYETKARAYTDSLVSFVLDTLNFPWAKSTMMPKCSRHVLG